jgi:hypothetical protein
VFWCSLAHVAIGDARPVGARSAGDRLRGASCESLGSERRSRAEAKFIDTVGRPVQAQLCWMSRASLGLPEEHQVLVRIAPGALRNVVDNSEASR